MGPGVSAEDIARIFSISPKRQAALREILASVREKSGRNNAGPKRSASKPSKKKAAAKK
jgi:hypothetical protein